MVRTLFCYFRCSLLAHCQHSEGPATGHLDTGFSRFPCAYKEKLRRFPTFQVATTCFSCSPPDLNLVVTKFTFCVHVKQPLPPGDNPTAVNKYYYVSTPTFNLGAKWRGMVNATSHSLYAPTRYPLNTRLYYGPRAVKDGCGKSRPDRLRSPDHPTRSESLYQLSYPDPQIHLRYLLNPTKDTSEMKQKARTKLVPFLLRRADARIK